MQQPPDTLTMQFHKKGYVNEPLAKLHNSPDGAVIQLLPKNQPVELLNSNTANWIKIKTTLKQENIHTVGYIPKTLISYHYPTNTQQLLKIQNHKLYASNGDYILTLFGKGGYSYGRSSLQACLEKSIQHRKAIPHTLLNIMSVFSVLSYNIDDIRTCNNNFLSFGLLQNSLGRGSEPGTLPTLIDTIKRQAPKAFEHYFLPYGVDTQITERTDMDLPHGYLTINGSPLIHPKQKEQMRSHHWAYIFTKLSSEDSVIHIQIQFLVRTIAALYNQTLPNNMGAVRDYVTSEFGICLLFACYLSEGATYITHLHNSIVELDKRTNSISNTSISTEAYEKTLIHLYLDNCNKRLDLACQNNIRYLMQCAENKYISTEINSFSRLYS